MSGNYQIHLTCDVPECYNKIIVVGHMSYEDARRLAQESHWVCLPNKRDLCPGHRDQAQQYDGREV